MNGSYWRQKKNYLQLKETILEVHFKLILLTITSLLFFVCVIENIVVAAPSNHACSINRNWKLYLTNRKFCCSDSLSFRCIFYIALLIFMRGMRKQPESTGLISCLLCKQIIYLFDSNGKKCKKTIQFQYWIGKNCLDNSLSSIRMLDIFFFLFLSLTIVNTKCNRNTIIPLTGMAKSSSPISVLFSFSKIQTFFQEEKI